MRAAWTVLTLRGGINRLADRAGTREGRQGREWDWAYLLVMGTAGASRRLSGVSGGVAHLRHEAN